MSDQPNPPEEKLWAQYDVLNYKFLCAAGGKPLKVKKIEVVADPDFNGGGVKEFLALSGWGEEVLITERNPEAGSKLPEELDGRLKSAFPDGILWEQRFPLGGGGDMKKAFDNLNAAFGLDDPLVDTEEELLRFFDEDERSVRKAILNTPIYVQMSVNTSKPRTEKYPPGMYFNIKPVSKRVEADKSMWEKLKARIEAKKAGIENPIPF